MKFCFTYLVICTFILLNGCNESGKDKTGETYIVKDDLGTGVDFKYPPKKIISLAPSTTEFIYLLGLEDRLQGNTLYCNYPEGAKKKTKVGDLLSVDYEKILTMKPDLIFISVEGNLKESYDKLKRLGFKLFVSNPRDFRGIKKTLKDFSRIFRIEEKADSIIDIWNKEFSEIKSSVVKYPENTCLFFIGLNPIMAAGKNTFINELITSAGLKNAISDSKFNYPVLNREQIIKRNPDYIFLTTDLSKNEKEIEQMYTEWRSIGAVVNKRVFTVDADMFSRPGPRFIEALKNLFLILHPEEGDSPARQEAVPAGNH